MINYNIKTILEVFGDFDNRKIISALHDNNDKTAEQIKNATGIPFTTLYRKLGLLKKSQVIDTYEHRTNSGMEDVFHTLLENLIITFDGKFDVKSIHQLSDFTAKEVFRN